MSNLFRNDHAEIAWSNFLAQHVGKKLTEAFVRSFYPALNNLDKAENDLYSLRWLDTSIGLQLDGVGSIVGIGREIPNSVYIPYFGFESQAAGRPFNTFRIRRERDPYAESSFLGDVEYLKLILAKIAVNNSHGTANDIITVMNAFLGVTSTAVYDIGNANARVFINDLSITPTDYRATIIDKIIPRVAGVQIFPYVFNRSKTFGFLNQQIYFGFGIGILARSIPSNIPVASVWDNGISDWDNGTSIWDLTGEP